VGSVLDDRKLAVLRAIVEDYVSTNEPVGSKNLVDRHNLDVSPATIRNDMAVLEEQGFIVQPHTSAGRVPTDKGYRLFVDRLSGVKPFSVAERRAIETFLAGAYDLDDVVMRTVRLLAQLTRQVAVIQYPTLTRSTVRHCEVVAPAALRGVITAVASVLIETLVEHPEERLLLGGTANLTRNAADFPHSLRQILEALEEQVVVLKLLASAQDPSTVTVRIGGENEAEEMRDTSVVSIGYGMSPVLGGMGVVGPTRMDYPGSIAAVHAVARYVGEILAAR
jgi:heat-inducible transcriptional repressor